MENGLLPLDRIPAVKRVGTSTLTVFALEISGEFNAADAENMCGLLAGAYTLKNRINLLVRINGLESFDTTGLAAETASQLRRDASQHVERCALVDDGGEAASYVAALLGSDLEVRTFAGTEEDQAWAYVGAVEVAGKV